MADIADIVIRVDSSQVTAASGNLNNLQKNTVGLLSSLSRAGAASLQYKREVALLNEANRQNILTHNELARSLVQLQSRYNSMGLAVDSAGNLMESSQAKANNFGHKVQQVGYQVGDFFVQVQSGTNVMVAFGQQATQLAGLIPGVLGAGLGIGISLFTAIGATLMRSSESAGTFQDALDKVKDSLSDTDDVLGLVNGDLEELKKNFGDLSSATQSLVDTKVDIALRGMADAAKSLRSELTEMYNGNAWGNTSRAQELGEVFRFGTQNTRELAAAMEELKNQDTLQGQVEAAARLRELFLAMAGPVGKMTSDERDFYIAMVEAEEASRRLLEATENVQEATQGTAEAQKINVEHAERYYQILLEQDALNKERDAAVQSLIDSRDDELRKLAQQKDMLQTILTFGKDSVEVREKEAQFAREAAEAELKRLGIVGNFLPPLMAAYDAMAATKAEVENASIAAENLETALQAAASAMAQLSGFSAGIDVKIAQAAAKVEALKTGANAANASLVAGLRAEAEQRRQTAASVAVGADQLREINRVYEDSIEGIKILEGLNNQASALEESTKKGAGGTNKLKKELDDAAKAAEQLRTQLEAPLVSAVGSISDAFGNFVARGLRDFKGFVKQILGSFQNMIAQMIAMAVKNRIMLSLGIGGITPGMAAAGQVAGLGTAGGILGSIGIGKGVAGLAGGTGFLGGAANTISGLAGGGAGLLNVGANAALAGVGGAATFASTIGAAMPIIGVGLALFSLFKKKPIIKPEDLKKVNDALDMTGQKLNLTGKEAQLAARELGKLAGGFDELSKKANFFFENFYTASEQQAMATTKAQKELNKVFKELGVSIPNTHEEYRQLVEAQDLTTESGRKMYTALLDVSGAFVTLRGSAEQAAQFMAQQSAAVNESVAQRKLGEFFDREFQARQIENVGTTLEQNDYLMNQLVEDYNKYVERFNDSLKGLSELDAPRLKPIDRQTLESMTDIDERLAEALGKTSKLQGTLLNWYEGVLKTSEDISNMIFEFVMSQGLGTVKAKGAALDYKRRGELPEGFLENFGKFGLFERLPYIFEVTQFVNDQILIFEDLEGNLRTTLEGLGRYADSWGGVGKAMADLNASFTGLGPTIANAGEMIGKISGLVVSAFESIRKGYEKIIEATDKVRTFFKDEFAALAQEYAKDTQLTQSTKVVERIEKVLEAPARLLDRLDYLMKKLDKKSDVAFSAIRSTEQTIRTLTASGQEVSEELRSSYSQMERSFREAREAGRKAREEIQKIRLFIETVSTATNEFVSAVEKMAVAPIEEGLKFFEPAMFSQMGDNVRRGMIDIFSALSEGGYEAFERGFVQLTDLLASEAITVDQFNNSFKIMRDVFLGNISLTDEYTTRQQTVVEKLSKAYGELTDVLDSALSIVRGGINALIGQLTAADVVANRRASTAYLQSVARTGQFDTTRLESAVGAVTSGDITGFGTRQEFARYIAITTQLLQSVEGTLGSQLDTLQMQQVKAILNIQDTSESAATSLQSISQLLSEFLGVGGRIPAFASGGYHTGGLRLVGENGPEIEATGPARIFSNREISVGDNSGLKQEIQGLRQDLNTALVQIAKNTRKSADTLNKFDYQGMPQDRDY